MGMVLETGSLHGIRRRRQWLRKPGHGRARAVRLGQGTTRLNRSSLVMTEAHCSGGGSVSVHGQGGGSDG